MAVPKQGSFGSSTNHSDILVPERANSQPHGISPRLPPTSCKFRIGEYGDGMEHGLNIVTTLAASIDDRKTCEQQDTKYSHLNIDTQWPSSNIRGKSSL